MAARLARLARHVIPVATPGPSAATERRTSGSAGGSPTAHSPANLDRRYLDDEDDGEMDLHDDYFPVEMSESEKFMFDLQGFLIVREFLSRDEVGALNAAFDANWDKRHEFAPASYDQFGGMLTWPHPHCQPFRDLLAHKKLLPYLNTMLGRGWHSDHSPFMIAGGCDTREAKGIPLDAAGGSLHGSTARHFDGTQFYSFSNGEMRSGLVVCAFQLADTNEGDGGFGIVPGSHKANYRIPSALGRSTVTGNSAVAPPPGFEGAVANPATAAGDLLIFNEACLHCTLAWTNPDTQRRSLLYRYCPRYLTLANTSAQFTQPDWVQDELTPQQQAVMEPAGIFSKGLIGNDGETIYRPGWDPHFRRIERSQRDWLRDGGLGEPVWTSAMPRHKYKPRTAG